MYRLCLMLGGVLLGLGFAHPAQAQLRDVTIPSETLSSLCRTGRQPPMDDLVINETNGGMGAVFFSGLSEPGLMVQAFPVAQLGGEAAAQAFLDQMAAEADGRRKVAIPSSLGDGGVMMVQYDRDGAEQARTLSFRQGDLLINITGITSAEVGVCGESAVSGLANLISRGLYFEGDLAAEVETPESDLSLLTGAQRVSADRCVMGSWALASMTMPPGLLAEASRQLSATDEARAELAEPAIRGSQYLTFEPDGSLWVENSAFTVTTGGTVYGADADWLDITIATVTNGSGAGSVAYYQRGGDKLVWTTFDPSDMTQDVIVTQEGYLRGEGVSRRSVTPTDAVRPALTDGVVRYTCNRETLVFQLDPPADAPAEARRLPPATWRYERLRD